MRFSPRRRIARTASSSQRLGGFVLVRLLLAALQVLAVGLSLELSGAVHIALDVASVDGASEHADDCDTEGHECPPGCPNCHVSHSVITSSAPRIELELKIVHRAHASAGFVPSETAPPTGNFRARLDRPPKASARG